MANPKRIPIVAGNWKMYKTIDETEAFITELAPKLPSEGVRVYLAVPFTALHSAAIMAEKTSIVVGAQNMNDATEGAFTGEVAGKMLKDAGAKFVLLGHSERRQIFGETNSFINLKVKRALEIGIQPILCIGETKEQREAGETEDTLATQLSECLQGIEVDQLGTLVIAYEPVWAIGTGLSASPEMAQEAHAFCREYLTQLYGKKLADSTLLLYGGSVKPETAEQLLHQADIDGLLVGGASLKVDSFASIVDAVAKD